MIRRSHLYEGGGGVLGKKIPVKEELDCLKELKATLHEWLGEPLGSMEEKETRGIGIGGGNSGPNRLC